MIKLFGWDRTEFNFDELAPIMSLPFKLRLKVHKFYVVSICPIAIRPLVAVLQMTFSFDVLLIRDALTWLLPFFSVQRMAQSVQHESITWGVGSTDDDVFSVLHIHGVWHHCVCIFTGTLHKAELQKWAIITVFWCTMYNFTRTAGIAMPYFIIFLNCFIILSVRLNLVALWY